MPNKDGTGPEGKGPRTGREMGNCKGAEPQESRRPRLGLRGLGRNQRNLGRNSDRPRRLFRRKARDSE
jgi:hypothetical protein